MNKRALIASSLLVAPGVWLAATGCSSSSSSASSDAGTDAKSHDAKASDAKVTAHEASTKDVGTEDVRDGGAAGLMHFIALNGLLPVASNVRYCVAASAGADPGLADAVSMLPQPTASTGLAAGYLSKIQVPSSIAGQNVRFFVYYTASLTAFGLSASTTCPELFAMSRPYGDAGIGTGGSGDGPTLQQTLDFDVSDIIPSSFFTATSKYLIYSTGCPKSSNPGAGTLMDPYYCNQTDGGQPLFLGDFHVYALQLGDTTPPNGKINVQGLVGVTELSYYNSAAQGGGAPEAWDIGVSASADAAAATQNNDSGLIGEGGAPLPQTLLNGPINGSQFPPGGNPFPADIQTGVLAPPTALPPLTQSSQVFYIASGYLAAGDGGTGFGGTGNFEFWPIDPILTLSGLTPADLTNGTNFTLIGFGDVSYTPPAGDASVNPFALNFRLIRNDNL